MRRTSAEARRWHGHRGRYQTPAVVIAKAHRGAAASPAAMEKKGLKGSEKSEQELPKQRMLPTEPGRPLHRSLAYLQVAVAVHRRVDRVGSVARSRRAEAHLGSILLAAAHRKRCQPVLHQQAGLSKAALVQGSNNLQNARAYRKGGGGGIVNRPPRYTPPFGARLSRPCARLGSRSRPYPPMRAHGPATPPA